MMKLDEIKNRYHAILKAYINKPEVSCLHDAANLSRELLNAEIPVEEIAKIHYEGLRQVGEQIDLSTNEALQRASAPLFEMLIVYIMALRKLFERYKREVDIVRKLSSAVEQCPILIAITDRKGRIEYVNPKFTQVTGYAAEEIIGKNISTLRPEGTQLEESKRLLDTINDGGKWHGEFQNKDKRGELYWESETISPIKDSRGAITHFIRVAEVITERKKAEEKIEHQAYHDSLTGLPNRQLLYDRLTVAIKYAQRRNKKLSVLFVDLDDFKKINDIHGHVVGDIMLQGVAKRLLTCCRAEDTVARVGGDEFVILLSAIDNMQDSTDVATRVIKSLATPIVIGGNELFIGTTVGISVYPFDGKDAGVLIKNADMAMYRAKDNGKNQYQLFTPNMNEEAIKRLKLENNLRRAWERKEFLSYYQPKVDLKTGAIVGIEALLRWKRPDGAFISPALFLPVAEKIGLITSFDEWILREACEFVRKIHKAGFDSLTVSVNLSAVNFDQNHLIGIVERILQETNLLPHHLELEVTERMLIQNIDNITKALHEMRNLGLCIAIDDFGTGYSSLNYLKRFPITTLKIDKSFVDDLSIDPKSRAIAKAIISMSHDMGIKVLAEGVETPVQLNYLNNIGCDEMQGYIFCPPVPKKKLEKLLKKGENLNSASVINR